MLRCPLLLIYLSGGHCWLQHASWDSFFFVYVLNDNFIYEAVFKTQEVYTWSCSCLGLGHDFISAHVVSTSTRGFTSRHPGISLHLTKHLHCFVPRLQTTFNQASWPKFVPCLELTLKNSFPKRNPMFLGPKLKQMPPLFCVYTSTSEFGFASHL